MSGSEPVAGGRWWNPWRGLGGLPRGIWVLFWATLVNRMGTMVLPFLVLWLTRERHYTAEKAGLVLGVFGLASLVASPLWGRLADRVGATAIMLISLFGSGLVMLLFPFVRGFGAILAATVLLSILNEAFRPANMSVVSHIAPPERFRAAYAVIRLAVNLGMSVGPAIGGFLAVWKFDAIFWVDGATSLVAGVVLLLVKLEDPRAKGAAIGETSGEDGTAPATVALPSLAAHRNAPLMLCMLGVALTGIVFFQHEGALPLFLTRDLHLAESTYGLMFTINTAMIVFLEVPISLATVGVPVAWLLAWGALLTGAGFGILALAGGLGVVIASVVLWTFGEMVLFPSMSARVAEMSPPDRRGEYMGVYTMTFGIAFTSGPWLGTVVYSRFGPAPLWIACLAVSAVSVLVFLAGREGERRISQEG